MSISPLTSFHNNYVKRVNDAVKTDMSVGDWLSATGNWLRHPRTSSMLINVALQSPLLTVVNVDLVTALGFRHKIQNILNTVCKARAGILS